MNRVKPLLSQCFLGTESSKQVVFCVLDVDTKVVIIFDFAIKPAIPRCNVTTLFSGFDRDNYPNMPICSPSRNGQYRCAKPVVFNDYRYSVTTVHPSGMPSSPHTSQAAYLFFTKVPLVATPESQEPVVSSEGSSVNKALT